MSLQFTQGRVALVALSGFVLGVCINGSVAGVRNVGASANLAATEPVPEIRSLEEGTRKEFLRAEDGLFYVDAMVNGTPIRFVLDTGATVVVLTEEDAERAGIHPDDLGPQGSMRTASGETSMQWAHLDSLNVAGRTMRRVDASITGSGLKVSLLGQNVLSRLGKVTISEDRLVIE